MQPTTDSLPSIRYLLEQRPISEEEPQNEKAKSLDEFSLIDLPKNPSKTLFKCFQEVGLCASDGHILKFIFLPNLDEFGVKEVHSFLSNLGLLKFLLHTVPDLKKMQIKPEHAFTIGGPDIFSIFGEKYITERLNQYGILLTKEHLGRFCNKPSRLKLKIDLKGASNVALNEFGNKIGNVLKRSGADILQKEFVDDGFNRYLSLTIRQNKMVVKITIIGATSLIPCSDSEDCCIPLSENILKELDNVHSSRDSKAFSKIAITPEGINNRGWRALILQLASCWAVDLRKIDKLGLNGMFNFFVSVTHGKRALNPQIEQQLTKLLLHNLKTHSIETLEEKLREEILNQFSSTKHALPVIIFNILNLLPESPEDNYPYREKLLTLLKQFKHDDSQKLQSTPWIERLHTLLETTSIPVDVIQAIFVIQTHLCECRKKSMGQKTILSAAANEKKSYSLTFPDTEITLNLLMDLPTALSVLSNYCSNNLIAVKDMQILCEQFYQGIEPSYPELSLHNKSNANNANSINNLVSIAEDLLSYEALRMTAFLLICQCGYILKIDYYLPILCKALPDLLNRADTAPQRLAILRHFLQYFEICSPKDNLFQDREKINGLLKKLAFPVLSSDQVILDCAKALAFSSNEDLAKAMLPTLQELPEKEYIPFAVKLITLHTADFDPSFALTLLTHFTDLKLTLYVQQDALFSNIKYKKGLTDLVRVGILATTILSHKLPSDEFGPGIKKCFEIIDFQIQKELFLDAAALLEKIESKGDPKHHHLNLFEMHLKLSKAFIEKKNWKLGFYHWHKAKFNCLKSLEPTDNRVTRLIMALLSVDPKKLDADMNESHRTLLIEAAINGLPVQLAHKVFLCLSDAYSDFVGNDNFISPFGRIGGWLLNTIEAYVENEGNPAQYNELKKYFVILQNIAPDSEERLIAESILGPHCLKEFIAEKYQQQQVSRGKIIASLTEEMLTSTSEQMQYCGFTLLSILAEVEDSFLEKLINALPGLLASTDPMINKNDIICRFIEYIGRCAPELIAEEELRKLMDCGHSGFQTFCEVFSTTTNPKFTFKAVFSTWQQLSTTIEVTSNLINTYLQKGHPELALKILAEQAKQGRLQAVGLEECWGQTLQRYKITENKLSQEELLSLVEIVAGIIPKVTHNKFGFKNKESFANDLCWLIEQLQDHELRSEALELYEAGNELKLFAKTHKSNTKLWFNLCSDLFKANKKPYALCNELLSTDPKQALDFLWNILQSAKETDEQILEALLKGVSSISHEPHALSFVKQLIVYFSKMDQKSLSKEVLHSLKTYLSTLIKILKEGIINQNIPAEDVLILLIDFLPQVNVDISKTLDEEKLWSHFLKINVENCSLSQQQINSLFKSSKEKSTDKAEFYFRLAKSNPSDIALTCFENAFAAMPSGAMLENDRFLLFSYSFMSLLVGGHHKRAYELLNKLDNLQLDLPLEWLTCQWGDVITLLSKNEPLLTGKILIEKRERLTSLQLQTQLKPIANEIALFLISHDQPPSQNLALKIGEYYGISETSFWQKALEVSSKNKIIKSELLSIFNRYPIPFDDTGKECEKYWKSLLENFSIDEYSNIFDFNASINDRLIIDFRLFFYCSLMEKYVSAAEKDKLSINNLLSKSCTFLAHTTLSEKQNHDFIIVNIKIIKCNLAQKNDVGLSTALRYLHFDLTKISLLPYHLDGHIQLVNEAVSLYRYKKNNVQVNECLKDILMFLGPHLASDDPLKLYCYLEKPDETTFRYVLNIAFSKEIKAIESCKLLKEEFQKYLAWLIVYTHHDKFDLLIYSLRNNQIFSDHERNRVVRLKIMNDLANFPIEEKDAQNVASINTLNSFINYIPQISSSEDGILDLHKSASRVLMNIFRNDHSVFIDTFFKILHSVIDGASIVGWLGASQLAFNHSDEFLEHLFPKKKAITGNNPALNKATEIKDYFKSLKDKCIKKWLESNSETKTGKVYRDTHLHYFLSTFLDAMINENSQPEQDQLKLLLCTHFFLDMYISLFTVVEDIPMKLLEYASRSYNISHKYCPLQYKMVHQLFTWRNSFQQQTKVSQRILVKLPPTMTVELIKSDFQEVLMRDAILHDERKNNFYYAYQSLHYLIQVQENSGHFCVFKGCLQSLIPTLLQANSRTAIAFTWKLIEKILKNMDDLNELCSFHSQFLSTIAPLVAQNHLILYHASHFAKILPGVVEHLRAKYPDTEFVLTQINNGTGEYLSQSSDEG
jgi:hypothetical protein